ncbi:hypothetical protein [Geobacillus stearothermophilus]
MSNFSATPRFTLFSCGKTPIQIKKVPLQAGKFPLKKGVMEAPVHRGWGHYATKKTADDDRNNKKDRRQADVHRHLKAMDAKMKKAE